MRSKATVTVVAVALLLGATACGAESKRPTANAPAPDPNPQSLDHLTERIDATLAAFDRKEWRVAYDMTTERCRAEVPFDEYLGRLMLGLSFLPDDVDWRREGGVEATFRGDEATVTYLVPDLEATVGPMTDRWVFEDGDYFLADCEGEG